MNRITQYLDPTADGILEMSDLETLVKHGEHIGYAKGRADGELGSRIGSFAFGVLVGIMTALFVGVVRW